MTDNLYQDLRTSDQSWHFDICSNKMSIQTNNEDLISDNSDELDEDIYAKLKQNLKIKGLKVANLNVNRLFHKLSEVKFLLEETKLDVLAVTETHLLEKIKNDTFTLITIVKLGMIDRTQITAGVGHLYILGMNKMVLKEKI